MYALTHFQIVNDVLFGLRMCDGLWLANMIIHATLILLLLHADHFLY
jgi:hypothetical protein